MSFETPSAAADWLALALMCGVLAAALGAALARSLFAMTMSMAVAAALGAAAVLAMGAAGAALALALFGLGLLPLILMAVLLLSASTAKPRRGAPPWATIAGALVAVMLLIACLFLAAPQLNVLASTMKLGAIGPWLAGLLLVAAAICVGLLGYGERGAFERATDSERDR